MASRRIKPIQVEQYHYAIRNSHSDGDSIRAYYIHGRVEDEYMHAPNRPIVGFSSDSHPLWKDLHDFGLWRPGVKANGAYDTSAAFASAMDAMTPLDSQGPGDVAPNSDGFAGNPDKCGMAYFPVVYRISPVHMHTSGIITNDYEQIAIVPFRVLAATWPWTPANPDDYTPSYRRITLPGAINTKIDLALDTRYLADDGNTYMAVMSSVLAVLPGRWQKALDDSNTLTVYITLGPAIGKNAMEEHEKQVQRIMGEAAPTGDGAFVFEGASLGAAVLAAIMGMPAFLYTGYNSQVGTDQILTDDPNHPIQNVALGANFVEPVDDIEYKVYGAILMGCPLIIPLNVSWYTEPSQQALYRGVSRALGTDRGKRTLLSLAAKRFAYPVHMQQAIALATNTHSWANDMSKFIYTAAKREAGWQYDLLPSLVLAAVNVSDMQILSAHAAAYMWPAGGLSVLIDRYAGSPGNSAQDRFKQRAFDLASDKREVERATELAKQVSEVDLKRSKQWELEQQRKYYGMMEVEKSQNPWDLDNIKYVNTAKKIRGRSGGKIKRKKAAPRKKSTAKKAAPKRKKTTKKKKKTTRKKPVADGAVPPKRKKKAKKVGGKKKRKGAKKGKSKKSKTKKGKKKSKKGKKKTRKSKKRLLDIGAAAGSFRGIGNASGYPMDRRIGSLIPLTRLTKRAKESALARLDPSARRAPLGGNPTARTLVRQHMQAKMGRKQQEKSVRFS